MANDDMPLSDEERAELEELRAQKAAREEAERNRQERAELEELRLLQAQQEQAQQISSSADSQDQERARLEAEARERGRKLMEPGDDLSMPLGQKLVLVGVALAVLISVALFVLMPH